MKDREFPNGFVRILFNCNRIILWALIIVVVVFISCRFIFYISTPWADELARYFLIALGWFGASYASSVGDHLEIDLVGSIVNKHSKDPQKILAVIDRFAQVLVLAFLIFFTYIYTQSHSHDFAHEFSYDWMCIADFAYFLQDITSL